MQTTSPEQSPYSYLRTYLSLLQLQAPQANPRGPFYPLETGYLSYLDLSSLVDTYELVTT